MSHKSQEDLQKSLNSALSKISVGAKYYHYKDPESKYNVEFVGILENSEEICVGYRALYGEGILWVRSIDDFLSEVEVGGSKTTRFTKVL